MRRIFSLVATLLGLLPLVAACSPSSSTTVADTWGGQRLAAGGGGMDALVAAAKAEGQLNVIGLPRDWVHYGFLIDGFHAKYGIKVNELDPNAISADEIAAATKAGHSKNAPDVFDLNMTVARANTAMFAPYMVESWNSIPDGQKDTGATWYQDYGGYMAIGEDTAKLPVVAQVADLLTPNFKGKVALKGDPTIDDTALNAVMMVALNQGGSLDNIGPGVDFFHKLRKQGNFIGVHATNSSVKALQTPVVLDWEFLSRAHTNDITTWQVVVPGVALLGTYYAQAINKQSPHPAAARLWEEYLYSTTGQNEWLRAGVRPVELAAMQTTGKVDPEAEAALPQVTGTPLFMSAAQVTAARTYLVANWARAIA